MHMFFKSIIAVLIFVLLIIPTSYAIEKNIDEKLPLHASLSDDMGFKHKQTSEKISDQNDVLVFSGIKGNRSLMVDGEEKGNTHIPSRSDYSLRSYITIQNGPQSMVNDITIDFSTRQSNTSFKMNFPSNIQDTLLIGSAFMTNLLMHEFGHAIVAEQVGATGNNIGFFIEEDGALLLGRSTVSYIEPKSRLPYVMGGEFFADLTFEQALKDYRKAPSTYNKSLLLFSGTDFLVYCLYAFTVDSENSTYDPVTISRETGMSKSALISVALAKTLLNAYRVNSGVDRVVPYFTVDNNSAALNLGIPF